MNKFHRLFILLCSLTFMLLSGCRAPAAPPTPTAVPPTATPLPTATTAPTPTAAETETAVPVTTDTAATPFIRGVDASFVPQLEAHNVTLSANGAPQDPLALLAANGINLIRLRVWVDPPSGHNHLNETLQMAQRIKQLGLGLLIDFHYSDTWADPDYQSKPAAWAFLSGDSLETAVYEHTRIVINALRDQGTLPDIVQIGNEISNGMLWNEGRVNDGYNEWRQLADLLNAGIAGVQDGAGPENDVPIMLHIHTGGDNNTSRRFFDRIRDAGVPFDVIGLSYYPWWQGTLQDLELNMRDLAQRYEKPVLVVETAYPWTLNWDDNLRNAVGEESQLLRGYPATAEGQARFLQDLIDTVADVPDNRGLGVVYWGAEYVTGLPAGSSWENMALFDFAGAMLPGLPALGGE